MRFLSVRPEVCPWVSRFPTSGFLQIPPHDGHPCLRLYPSRYRADSGLSPVRNVRRQAHRQKAAAPAGVSTRGATASRLSDLSNQKLLLFFFASRESCKCHKQAGQKHHYRSLGRLLSGLRQRCQRNISIIDGGSGSLRRERSQRHVAFID